jgi:hypothetical protein
VTSWNYHFITVLDKNEDFESRSPEPSTLYSISLYSILSQNSLSVPVIPPSIVVDFCGDVAMRIVSVIPKLVPRHLSVLILERSSVSAQDK